MTREKAIEDARIAVGDPKWGGLSPRHAEDVVAILEALGLIKFGETPPIRPLFDPQADAAVSAVIEKTLYEKDWPDTAVAGFIIDDLHKAGFKIVRNTP
jgi:hypothetical protein